MPSPVENTIADVQLPNIPVLDLGPDWPLVSLRREFDRTHALLNDAARNLPDFALKLGDIASRRWLAKWDSAHLAEIDEIARHVGRPGAYFLNISYEWGCTTRVGPAPNGESAQLVRVLDWSFKGLGRHVIAARIDHGASPWVSLTWPGYTGVLQAMAPGRFSAALNQAPMETPLGFLPVDWTISRARVWRSPHPTPAHLLRMVLENAGTYHQAKDMLTKHPIAIPAIFTVGGLHPEEGCVIERLREEAHVHPAPVCAANEWQTPHWRGHVRGHGNADRRACLRGATILDDTDFGWLQPPVLNGHTRLALVADAAAGHLRAIGIEDNAPATQILDLRF